MGRLGAWIFAVFFCLTLGGPVAQSSRPVVADLSSHLVAITTGFSGSEVLMFGATNEQPGHIVMVVRGPKETHIVRRKERVAGIWVNRHEARFEEIPAYYAVAASGLLTEIVPPDVRKRHQIGLNALRLPARDADNKQMTNEDAKPFRKALIHLKQKSGLYTKHIAAVSTLENRLFRATVRLPSSVPVGSYTVEVYFIHNGEVIGAEITPLFVSKTGYSADIFDFAMNQPAKYAILCILFAVVAGWGIALVFRR